MNQAVSDINHNDIRFLYLIKYYKINTVGWDIKVNYNRFDFLDIYLAILASLSACAWRHASTQVHLNDNG